MPYHQLTTLPPERIERLLESLEAFIEKTAEIINKNHVEPTPNSRASEEINSFADNELVRVVYFRAYLCFESAADH